ncbi:MAG: DUF3987 domain-containing protein [Deltaproteobacteria bacterium]|nr:DUF3987 domain-containing protein [Deltaproteobacteria bacterium]
MTGGNAMANNPRTWGEFELAVRHWEAHKNNGIAGIGYEFDADDPFSGVDLDNCHNPETGEIEPWAQEIITSLDSYTEISPSGRGVHIIIKGAVHTGGNKKGLVEMYSRGHYFTMTGRHLEGTPTTIEDRQQELEALHREVFGEAQKPKTPPTRPIPALDLSDQELIDRAHQATNGEKFGRLWRGDTSGYSSASEATAALLNLLVFWFGANPARIDRLFRQSGLIRDKWDRPTSGSTWGALEIQKAMARATEFYAPGQGPPDDASSHREKGEKAAIEAPDPLIPIFPEGVMTGAAGAFARCYASYLETPKPFLFLNYLTLLGHVVSDKITLASEIAPQPRLYTINLGESSDTRKTTSINKVHSFFLDVVKPEDINLIFGVGSAEGLTKAFRENHRGVLVLDELKALVQKMRIDSSVLLPCINTLFELNLYHSLTKNHDIKIDNAELCLLAASTVDTYRSMFTPQFLDIGFVNRLFIIVGGSERKFAIPQVVPEHQKETLRSDLREVLKFVESISQAGRHPLPLTSEARDIFESWYFGLEKSIYSKRLDTYGHRIMILLAVNDMQATITPEIAERTVALLDYQLAARRFADPIDADNYLARVEEKIRRLLASGPLQKRDLEKHGHKHRVGSWLWSMAIKNLTTAEEISFDAKTKFYRRLSDS